MSLFDGMESAQPGMGGVYLTDGLYGDLEILALKSVRNRKQVNGFCAELMVHASTGPNALMPGTKCAWMSMEDKDSFLGSVRGFLQVAMSEMAGAKMDLKEIDKDAAELAVSDENPFKGVRIRAQATQVKTKAGGDFTKVEWSPKSFDMR